MVQTQQIADHRALLRKGSPILDVRAPEEYRQGHFPNSVNLPLLNDEERHQVGLCYKNHGQERAVELGYQLLQGAARIERIQSWQHQLRNHPASIICCWRGGMRSHIAQQWLEQAGITASRVEGGYKALRHCALEVLSTFPGKLRCLILGGRTGSGKTQLLNEFECSIDLEGLANHRGSAFGARTTAQPTPASFENALAAEVLQKTGWPWLILEDEGRTVGRLGLPHSFIQTMAESSLVVLEVPRQERAAVIYAEYVVAPLASGLNASRLKDRYLDALTRIQRRLGGARHRELTRLLDDAFQMSTEESHRRWIEGLLQWYYDPMYDYQLKRKDQRVIFRGNRASVRDYLNKLVTENTFAEGGSKP